MIRRLFAALVAGLVFSSSSVALAESELETLERLKRRKTCVDAVEEAVARFDTILKTWLVDSTSKLHVGRNFELLRNKHDSFFTAVRTFVAERSAIPADLEGLERVIKEIDGAHVGLTRSLVEVRDADELFLVSLPSIDAGLVEVAGEAEGAKAPCEGQADALEAVEATLQQVKSARVELGVVGAYVSEAAGKRAQLFEAALAERRIALMRAYAERVGQELRPLAAKIDAALALGRLQGRIQMWWQEAAVLSGIGRGRVTRDLQYTDALRVLRIDAQQAQDFERDLGRVVDVPAQAKALVAADLARFSKQITDQIDKLESGGWQAVMARQRLLSDKRKSTLDRYAAGCADAIAAWEAAAARASSQDSFGEAEKAYVVQINTCVARH